MNVLYIGPENKTANVRTNLPTDWDVMHSTNRQKIKTHISKFDVIFDAYMGIEFGNELLKSASNLQLFITGTTGYDHIDIQTLQNNNVEFKCLKGETEFLKKLTPAAEHSWLLLLACARKLRSAINHVLEGKWDRNQFPGVMLREKKLGIIGCGRNGQWMAEYADAFGMTNCGYDPHLETWPENIKQMNLETLLTQSDVVTIHVPLNYETRGLIGKPELEMMKDDAILVNTSRGAVIDEEALRDVLERNGIAGAGLDVLAPEPDIVKSPIFEYATQNDDVIITPHIGGFSPDALDNVIEFSCERIKQEFDI